MILIETKNAFTQITLWETFCISYRLNFNDFFTTGEGITDWTYRF